MIDCKVRIIHERSKNSHILKNLSTSDFTRKDVSYSLKQNCFDPSKSSPPNDFMLKLHKRMSVYDYLETKDDKRSNE
jgi:hypothetical protein